MPQAVPQGHGGVGGSPAANPASAAPSTSATPSSGTASPALTAPPLGPGNKMTKAQDAEWALMQKTLEKEVRHAQTQKGTPHSTSSSPAAQGPPAGLFSVLTPDGRVITANNISSQDFNRGR